MYHNTSSEGALVAPEPSAVRIDESVPPPAPVHEMAARQPWAAISPESGRGISLQLVVMAIWLADVVVIAAVGLLLNRLGFVQQIDRLLPFVLVCYTGVARIAGGYDLDGLFYIKRCWPRVANAWLCTMLSIAALSYGLDVAALVPLADVALWFVGGAAGIGLARVLLVFLIRRLKRAGSFDSRTAIVGTGPQGLELVRYIAEHSELAMSVVGFFDDARPTTRQAAALPLPYFGDIGDLIAAIRGGAVDTVFVALPWSDEARLAAVVGALSETPVEIRLAPDRAGFAYARRRVSSLAGLSVITLLEQPLSNLQQLTKAIEDRVIAAIALVLLAPLMLAVAIAIKATSPGPVLFRQPREGFNCRPFDILKFRTMYEAAGQASDVVQAQRRDPRVTRVGAILRRTSIDELPQLFNVLLGHMSLVGPRPHAASTRAGGKLFAEIAASYAARHKVKPGLTGWAQVCGWRGETRTEEALVKRLEHDMYYVEHWSIWFDLYILGRTVATVLLQRTAY